MSASLPVFETAPISASTSPVTLRIYQEKALARLRALVTKGKRRILCVGPTGMGKMVLIAAILRSSKWPGLFLAHRMELIDQCCDHLARAGVTQLGVIRAQDDRANPSASLQVASIQTLIRRNKPFPQEEILVLIDEAHRACMDNSYGHFIEQYPKALVIGFTATPCRLDGKPLDLFEVLEVVATYAELFNRPEWLVPPTIYAAPEAPDLRAVRTVAGDFVEDELAKVMLSPKLQGPIVETWLKLAGRHPGPKPRTWVEGERRRTFLFATGIEHSKELVARFVAAGVRAEHLDGTTPEDQRRDLICALGEGRIEILSNCNVLLEGVDIPSAKCVIHARPTQSLLLWRQSVGRIFRPWNGVLPLIFDHAGNTDRLGMPHEDMHWSLEGRPKKKGEAPTRKCPFCFAYVPLGAHFCPECGAELPRKERALTEDDRVQLAERNAEPQDMKRTFYDRAATTARARGFKPGYAGAKFKERYGHWPPWGWSEETKFQFANDPGWQAVLASRLARKEAEARAPEPPPDPEPQPTVEPAEEDFSSWLREEGVIE
jgi:DNA repair protein RadD